MTVTASGELERLATSKGDSSTRLGPVILKLLNYATLCLCYIRCEAVQHPPRVYHRPHELVTLNLSFPSVPLSPVHMHKAILQTAYIFVTCG